MIFSMIKPSLVVMLALFIITFASAQDVRYYKLTRKVENGKSSTNVAGGQFITFLSDICFESNNHGVGVNHGTMERNKNYSNSEYSIYQQKTGSGCYWGKNATFKFNSDKSVLNVILDNGDVYVYKRTTAPVGQETCSLIREKPSTNGDNNGNFAGGFTPQPVYPVEPYNPTPTQPSNSNTGTTHQKPRYEWHEVTEDCYMCHGSGKCPTCNGKHWFTTQFGQRAECPNCKPDGRCSVCGGSGKITKRKYY